MKILQLKNHLDEFVNLLEKHEKLHNSSIDPITFEYNRNYEELEKQSRNLSKKLGLLQPFILKYDPHWLIGASGATWNALDYSVGMGGLVYKDSSIRVVLDKIYKFQGHLEGLSENEDFNSILDGQNEEENLKDFIKQTMISVATGNSTIQDVNKSYQEAYKELDSIYKKRNDRHMNPFSDLWEFYKYWKDNLKSYAERRDYVLKLYKETHSDQPVVELFVSEQRLEELSSLKCDFDLTKLLRLLHELNSNYSAKNFFSCAMLMRSVIDHIPPLFGYGSFNEVANNHGSRSFKELMDKLNSSMRKISDSYLHSHIRKKESLPSETQIRFYSELDVLLGEIVRSLSESNK